MVVCLTEWAKWARYASCMAAMLDGEHRGPQAEYMFCVLHFKRIVTMVSLGRGVGSEPVVMMADLPVIGLGDLPRLVRGSGTTATC